MISMFAMTTKPNFINELKQPPLLSILQPDVETRLHRLAPRRGDRQFVGPLSPSGGGARSTSAAELQVGGSISSWSGFEPE